MSRDDIPPGTRVRLKVRTIFGWRGTATMLFCGKAIKDDGADWRTDTVDACLHEWAVLRDQTPNPGHAEALRDYLDEGTD
jgi:hypothetical protein